MAGFITLRDQGFYDVPDVLQQAATSFQNLKIQREEEARIQQQQAFNQAMQRAQEDRAQRQFNLAMLQRGTAMIPQNIDTSTTMTGQSATTTAPTSLVDVSAMRGQPATPPVPSLSDLISGQLANMASAQPIAGNTQIGNVSPDMMAAILQRINSANATVPIQARPPTYESSWPASPTSTMVDSGVEQVPASQVIDQRLINAPLPDEGTAAAQAILPQQSLPKLDFTTLMQMAAQQQAQQPPPGAVQQAATQAAAVATGGQPASEQPAIQPSTITMRTTPAYRDLPDEVVAQYNAISPGLGDQMRVNARAGIGLPASQSVTEPTELNRAAQQAKQIQEMSEYRMESVRQRVMQSQMSNENKQRQLDIMQDHYDEIGRHNKQMEDLRQRGINGVGPTLTNYASLQRDAQNAVYKAQQKIDTLKKSPNAVDKNPTTQLIYQNDLASAQMELSQAQVELARRKNDTDEFIRGAKIRTNADGSPMTNPDGSFNTAGADVNGAMGVLQRQNNSAWSQIDAASLGVQPSEQPVSQPAQQQPPVRTLLDMTPATRQDALNPRTGAFKFSNGKYSLNIKSLDDLPTNTQGKAGSVLNVASFIASGEAAHLTGAPIPPDLMQQAVSMVIANDPNAAARFRQQSAQAAVRPPQMVNGKYPEASVDAYFSAATNPKTGKPFTAEEIATFKENLRKKNQLASASSQ